MARSAVGPPRRGGGARFRRRHRAVGRRARPAHLVEELVRADKLAPAHADRLKPGLWQRMLGGPRPAQRWRIVGACAVVLIAAGVSWSFYEQQFGFVSAPPAPMEKTTIEQPAVADAPAPAPPRPAIAARQSCETRKKASARAAAQPGKPESAARLSADTASECDDSPDHQLADQPASETTKQAAEQQAAAARSAAEAASKAGASQAGEAAPNPVDADHAGRLLGSRDHNRPAATAPAARPAAPAR